MIKNGMVASGDTEMYYVSFGSGSRKLIVLPGLSDGLATVRGKALVLSVPYKKKQEIFTKGSWNTAAGKEDKKSGQPDEAVRLMLF